MSGASETQRMEPLGLPILGEATPASVGCMQLPLLVTRAEVSRISLVEDLSGDYTMTV